jgi:hypothetical protein
MYFTGLDFFPKTPFFTDVMLGLVNICFNLSRRAVPNPSHPSWSDVVNETFGGLEDADFLLLPENSAPGLPQKIFGTIYFSPPFKIIARFFFFIHI